jgi:hypothetical protein
MAADEVHIGDVGTIFQLTVKDQDNDVVDISVASTLNIIFRKPNGTNVTKTAVLTGDGTDGKMQYTTVADDLDDDGLWKLQGFVDFGTTEWYTDVIRFTVYRNL